MARRAIAVWWQVGGAIVAGVLLSGGASTPLTFPGDLLKAPPTADGAVLVAQSRDSSIVVLEPPRQADYWLVATAAGGAVEITGFVPDDATRKRLAAIPGVTADDLSLARGEPAAFGDAVDFGLAVLGHLSEGRFEVREEAITLEGRAASIDDYAAIESLSPPTGFDLAMGGIRPPVADPFVWTAAKIADGPLSFSGFVAAAATRARLASAAGAGVASDTTAVADGAPDGFEEAVIAGLGVLAELPAGTVRYDGTAWHIEADAETTLQAARARTAFREAGLDAAGWVYAVTLPPAPAVETPPMIEAYAWSAEKLPAGTIALDGYVPTEGMRRVLVSRAGEQVVDQLELGAGAPESFPLDVLAAIDALKALEEGRVAFADGAWTLTGRSDEPGAPDAVTAALGDRAAAWQVAVTAPPPPPPAADPFIWSATKTADGGVSFAGYFATPQLKAFAAVRTDTVAADTTEIASGAPEGFIPDVMAALDALLALKEGEVRFDGTAWSLSGDPETVAKRDAAIAALGTGATPAEQWRVALVEPPVPVEEPVEVAEPEVVETPLDDPATAEPAAEVAVAEPAPLETPEPLETPAIETPAETDATAPAETDVAVGSGVTAAPDASTEVAVETPVTEPVAPEAETPAETAVAAIEPEAAATPEPAVPDAPAVAEPSPEPDPGPVQVALAPEPVRVTIPDRVVFDATRAEGSPVTLAGSVPAAAAQSYFGVIAGKVPTEGLTVADNLPSDFIANADAGLRILTQLYDGRLAYDGSNWYLTGTVNSEAERAEATQQALITLPASGNWTTGIGLTPPIKVCRLLAANFAANSPILFQSGSARMTDESVASLGELATDLEACPDTAVYIEGHTDADGADELNLALSVARAEAVVDALVGLGVGYQRLYAVGYGESLPIADNESAAGKRANRRIVVTILENGE